MSDCSVGCLELFSESSTSLIAFRRFDRFFFFGGAASGYASENLIISTFIVNVKVDPWPKFCSALIVPPHWLQIYLQTASPKP